MTSARGGACGWGFAGAPTLPVSGQVRGRAWPAEQRLLVSPTPLPLAVQVRRGPLNSCLAGFVAPTPLPWFWAVAASEFGSDNVGLSVLLPCPLVVRVRMGWSALVPCRFLLNVLTVCYSGGPPPLFDEHACDIFRSPL